MRRKTKKILLISNFSLIVIFFAVLFLFIYFSYSEPLTKKLITDKPVNFVLTFYGTENLLPDIVESYYVHYERESGRLKVLSINTDIVVFRKKVKARSLSYSFFNTAQKDLNLALTNFHQDVFEMTGNVFTPDYYITASFESLLKMAGKNPELKEFITEKEFANRDLRCLSQLEFAECVLALFQNKMLSSVMNMRKSYTLLDTNISKLAFTNMIMYFKMYDAEIMFFDLPAKYTKTRVEPDKDNIEAMLFTVYYPFVGTEPETLEGFVEVKNASGKPRMAEKAAWQLRENKIDVLEWGNNSTPYEKTLIKNYKGNYDAVKKIIPALGCGKIINSYNNKSSFAAGIYIGKDCEIYDKLDKKEAVNGEN